MSGILQLFVRAFFDENPLSQLGLIVMRNGVAERLTELSSSPVCDLPAGCVGGCTCCLVTPGGACACTI
jgi:transcription initiation factor TFIIH subunit 2